MRYWLVMPAAGVGRRFGGQTPKQYAELQGRTVMEWALAPFLGDSRCAGAVVVVAAGDPYWPAIAARLSAPGSRAATASEPTKVISAAGAQERCGSVRNGLAALATHAAAEDWVLVHDAARPCISTEDRDELLERVHDHPVGGLLAAPAADTLKRAVAGQQVAETVDRTGLWRALTPQMFRYKRLCDALDRASADGRQPTDEAQALEWTGERPVLVAGSTANIKITNSDDLAIAVALLAARVSACAAGGNAT
jgi:2-C-methyl-D-erythritol 4-phosphate cytidylyltransferase